MKYFINVVCIICIISILLACSSDITNDQQVEPKPIKRTKVVLGIHGRDHASKLATNNKELLKMKMRSSNPAERIYTFWAYLIQGNTDYQEELQKLITDTTLVESLYDGNGDFGQIEVRRAVLQIAQNLDTLYGIYQPLNYLLDSLILTLPYEGALSGIVHCRMANIAKDDRFHKILRKRAYYGSGKRGAAIGLSKFKYERDTQLIKNLLYSEETLLTGISCVENFQHIAFQEPLIEAFNRRLKLKYPITLSSICELLLIYDTEESNRAINSIIKNSDSLYYHVAILKLAMDRLSVNLTPNKKKIVRKIGKNELEKRIEEYSSDEYWRRSRDEKNTDNTR